MPRIISITPINRTIQVIPPLRTTNAAFPQETKGIPGRIKTKGIITNNNPRKISNHLFIVLFCIEFSLKRFL